MSVILKSIKSENYTLLVEEKIQVPDKNTHQLDSYSTEIICSVYAVGSKEHISEKMIELAREGRDFALVKNIPVTIDMNVKFNVEG